jgi:bifunctional DNase/RNase
MQQRPSTPKTTWLYVAKRVWWRLLLALYPQRVKIIGASLALLAFGLFSIVRGGSPGQAAIIGVMPVAVSVLKLEWHGDELPLVLKESDGGRQLLIDLDITEALVIAREQGLRVQGDPPQAYDLLRDLIAELGGRVDHVSIAETDDGGSMTARILVALDNGDTRVLRARAPEAVALALKTGARIYVERSLFDRAGVAP